MMAGMGADGTNAFTSFEQTVYTEDVPANVVDKFLAVQSERFRQPVLRLFHTELEAVYEEKNRSLMMTEIKYMI
jgi:predicted Zn-dependent peptidase